MRHSKINTESVIYLTALCVKGNTPAKAVNEAIEFVKEHGLMFVWLNYKGFNMCIDEESDINQLLEDYHYWKNAQKEL